MTGARQRVVVYHDGGAETVYATIYGNDQATDALLSCHRDHPDAKVEVHDAQEHREAQEYMGGEW